MADGQQHAAAVAAADDDERTPLVRFRRASPNNGDELSGMNQQLRSWRRRRWISLVCSLLLLVGFVVILILSGVLSRNRKNKPMAASTCLTPACIHAASEILYNLSPDYQTIDPCVNFDTLVCDGFNDRHDIPEDRSSYSTMSAMSDQGQVILRHILESPYPSASQRLSFSPMHLMNAAAFTDEQNFAKMQTAYNSCMNTTALQEAGAAPIVDLISLVTQSFPVAESSNEPLLEADHASLSKTIELLEKMGVGTFEGITTGADDKHPDLVIIQAFPAGLSLPSPEYYKDNDTVELYHTVLEEVFASLLPTKSSRGSAAKIAQSVIDLEKDIASITPPVEDQQDVTKYYHIAKVADLGKINPALGLDSVIKALVPADYTVDTMLLTFPDFLADLSKILSKTSKSTIQSYLIWSVITAFASSVEAPEVEPITRLSNVLAGRAPNTKPERWTKCLKTVDSSLGWILSRFYIEAAFSEEGKEFGDKVIMDIKHQFSKKLNALTWMDDSVKELATNKVKLIDQKIGYPTSSPDIRSPEALGKYYRDLDITSSFFNNSKSVSTWDVEQTWSKLGKPVDRGEWMMTADTVNAYYNPVGNEIVFPAAIMQFPFFGVDLPSYISYGAFASIAGHELSHAFDSSGRHYDEHGNFTDWWTNHTVEEFQKRADCFVEQYSNFTIKDDKGEDIHVNGKLTLGENIADAGGVSAAFAAWNDHRATAADESLPGLDHFTHEQLFYVFYANAWCGQVRKAQAVNYIYTDPHSPSFARILGTLGNSRGFRESFNCPVKEPTCELW